MEFDTWKPGTPDYANVDTEVRMRLTTLFFFCNRPTVGALMALGGDLGDAFKAADGTEDASRGCEGDRGTLEAAESSASEADYEPGVCCARSSCIIHPHEYYFKLLQTFSKRNSRPHSSSTTARVQQPSCLIGAGHVWRLWAA